MDSSWRSTHRCKIVIIIKLKPIFDDVSQSKMTFPLIRSDTYLERGYHSVHCGLTARRVRSRAHLLKSGRETTTGLNECLPLHAEATKRKRTCGLHAGIVQSLL